MRRRRNVRRSHRAPHQSGSGISSQLGPCRVRQYEQSSCDGDGTENGPPPKPARRRPHRGHRLPDPSSPPESLPIDDDGTAMGPLLLDRPKRLEKRRPGGSARLGPSPSTGRSSPAVPIGAEGLEEEDAADDESDRPTRRGDTWTQKSESDRTETDQQQEGLASNQVPPHRDKPKFPMGRKGS